VPDAVEDAIVRAMAKVPADRFRSAIDFANALTDNEGAALRRANSLRNSAIPASTVTDTRVAGGGKKKAMLAALVAIPVLLGVGWFAYGKTSGGAVDPKLAAMKANDIAVLYFDDRSPDQSLRYLSEGLTEALIHELGMVSALHVTSRNGVMPFKGKDITPDSIAKALNVGTIVSGTVATRGDRLRVTVELIDARTGDAIGSTTVEKTKQDAFALQDTLVKEVSTALRKQLGQAVQVLTSRGGTKNAAAWEGFQRAKQTVSQGDSLLAAGNAPAATSMLSRADQELGVVAAADPKWSAPTALQGMLNYRLARLDLDRAGLSAAAARIDSGLARAERAVSATPEDPDALEARGTLRYLQWLLGLTPAANADKALDAAEADLVASTKINPAQASALNTLSHLYHFTDRTSDGNIVALKAYTADPYLSDINKTILRLFQTSLDLNNGQQSKRWCDEGARRFPDDFRFAECRLWLLTLPDPPKPPTPDEIWSVYDAYLAKDKVENPEYAKRKGLILAAIGLTRAGLPDSARSVLTRVQGNESIDPAGDLIKFEAMARTQLGEKDKAISLLGRYIAAHPQQGASRKHPDESWWFKPLETEPRYRSMVGLDK
jgi:TolB-like protein